MGDYGLEHNGRVFTLDSTAVTPEENARRNAAIEAAELATWAGKPERFTAYYSFPKWGTHFPLACARVRTWQGTELGKIVSARVYRHSFGGRFVSIRVQGSNGAMYHGRASWDWGEVIRLRRMK